MTYASLVGNAFIVFGPIISIFLFYLYQIPLLVIVFVAASFFYVLAMAFVSLFYFIPGIGSLQILIVSIGVLIHELIRFIFFLIYRQTEKGYEKNIRVKLLYTKFGYFHVGVAAGLGYASSYALITFGTVLMQSYGPGTYYAPNCPSIPYFVFASVITLCFVLLNIEWMVIAFEGYSRKSTWRLITVVATHFIASCLVSHFAQMLTI
jgi:anterior pharynx defective protein 1